MIPESYMEWPAQSKGEDPTEDRSGLDDGGDFRQRLLTK
jgi:hypothetical protein